MNSLQPSICQRLSCQGPPQGVESNQFSRAPDGGGTSSRACLLAGETGAQWPGPDFWASVDSSAEWGWSYYQSHMVVLRLKGGDTCRGPKRLTGVSDCSEAAALTPSVKSHGLSNAFYWIMQWLVAVSLYEGTPGAPVTGLMLKNLLRTVSSSEGLGRSPPFHLSLGGCLS